MTEVHLTTPNGNQIIYTYNEEGRMISSKCDGKNRIKLVDKVEKEANDEVARMFNILKRKSK
jgi:hypothetical protein